MKKATLALILFVLPALAQAEVKVDLGISDRPVQQALSPWLNSLVNDSTMAYQPYVSCKSLSHNRPQNTMLCFNVGIAESMFSVLGRASLFTEGNFGVQSGTVVSHEKAFELSQASENSLFGYNFKGEDLRRFLEAVTAECSKDQAKCLSAEEQTFFDAIRSHLDDQLVLITATFFPMFYGDQTLTAASHELIHALYFRVADYRNLVDRFWRERVSEADKESVRQAFKGIYDTRNEYVLVNEFQAHVLQRAPEQGLLPELSVKYREALLKTLGELAPSEY